LRSCLGVTDGTNRRWEIGWLGVLCIPVLFPCVARWINREDEDEDESVYGGEGVEMMMVLGEIRDFVPTRLVMV
jgi:hypothetical protein